MVELTRTIRFAINPEPDAASRAWAGDNTFAGSPSMRGLARHYELDVRCVGGIDPATGYFVNIKEIDRATREAAVPVIERVCADRPGQEPSSVLADVVSALASSLPVRLAAVRWWLSPYYSVEMNASRTDRALLRQRFEFAASHRLHADSLSDEENRAVFGKCNNPSGHGHNYRVEPCVETPTGAGAAFSLEHLERCVRESIIDRFDHKHLNVDTEEFRDGQGLNPSVENIARVCFEILHPKIEGLGRGATLRSVTVWETDKTSCTYPG